MQEPEACEAFEMWVYCLVCHGLWNHTSPLATLIIAFYLQCEVRNKASFPHTKVWTQPPSSSRVPALSKLLGCNPSPLTFPPQAKQSRQEQRQEEAADRRLRKASKEVLQMRGQSQKEPLPVQTFREKMAFFTRPRFNIPPLPADDVWVQGSILHDLIWSICLFYFYFVLCSLFCVFVCKSPWSN